MNLRKRIFSGRNNNSISGKYRFYKDRIIFGLVIVLLWEFLARAGFFPELLFPRASVIGKRFIEMLGGEGLLQSTLYSISIVFYAMLLSLLTVILFVFLTRRLFFLKNILQMLNSLLAPLPGIAILPLAILWLGVNQRAMLLIIVHATIWPLWLQLDLAIERIEKRFSRFVKAFRLPLPDRVYHLYYQGTKEDLRRALAISWSRGWRALISVEMVFGMVGNKTGLGWLILERRMYMDTAGLYAGIIAIAFCGLLFESLIFKKGEKGADEP